jgi:hypothetical protein
MTLTRLLAYAAILALFVIAGRILEGQTSTAPRNLAPGIPGGTLFVIAPDGRIAQARLDPSIELTADLQGFLTLRATAQITERVSIFKPTAATSTITLPSDPRGPLDVSVNGFMLADPDDYSRAARVVTFVPRWAPVAGDLVRVRYRE